MSYFIKLGFPPSNLYGIDILEERISEGKKRFPNINWVCGDASNMKMFDDGYFDIVFESTMFIQVTNDNLAGDIASEMVRVCKPHKYIVLADWRYSKPKDKNYKALSKSRISTLFGVGFRSKILGVYKGALIPPVGRFLSKNAPSLYFVIKTLFPIPGGSDCNHFAKEVFKDVQFYGEALL